MTEAQYHVLVILVSANLESKGGDRLLGKGSYDTPNHAAPFVWNLWAVPSGKRQVGQQKLTEQGYEAMNDMTKYI